MRNVHLRHTVQIHKAPADPVRGVQAYRAEVHETDSDTGETCVADIMEADTLEGLANLFWEVFKERRKPWNFDFSVKMAFFDAMLVHHNAS